MNAPKSVEYAETVFEQAGAIRLFAQDLLDNGHLFSGAIGDVMAIRDAADRLLALSGPVSGMDTSSVAGAPCEQAGSHTGGLTPLDMELVEALKQIDAADKACPIRSGRSNADSCSLCGATDRQGCGRNVVALGNLEKVARSAIAKAEATATEAQHAGQWVLVPREPTEEMLLAAWREDYRSEGATEDEIKVLVTVRWITERHKVIAAYRAMIAAAPPTPADAEGRQP